VSHAKSQVRTVFALRIVENSRYDAGRVPNPASIGYHGRLVNPNDPLPPGPKTKTAGLVVFEFQEKAAANLGSGVRDGRDESQAVGFAFAECFAEFRDFGLQGRMCVLRQNDVCIGPRWAVFFEMSHANLLFGLR